MNNSGKSRSTYTPTAPGIGIQTAMRRCAGECARRLSVGQFVAGSDVCVRCERRRAK
jgi:hypothetical protein